MTEEEPKSLFMRFHKSQIVREDEEVIWMNLGDAMQFLEQVMRAITNPNMAVVRE